MTHETLLERFAGLIGAQNVLTRSTEVAPYCVDWSGRFRGTALAVLRPGSTSEVAGIVRLCREAGVAIVPQGGNTGLAGGATPDCQVPSVVVQLGRLRQVRAIDTVNNTLVVEAGVTLAELRRVANEAGRIFPLSLASEGSCTVGGNLATNAGGAAVLRYGNMRALCLGLEVVTPDGQVWDGLRHLHKDNTGYALRELYIGSEGTLGLITAAVLRLFPKPALQLTCLLAVSDAASAVALLQFARDAFGADLTAFELMSPATLEPLPQLMPKLRLPLASPFPWALLLEVSASWTPNAGYDADRQMQRPNAAATLRSDMEAVLAGALEAGFAQDAIIATSQEQVRALWAVREAIPVGQARLGTMLRYDLSLPITAIPEFLETAEKLLTTSWPDLVVAVFGHVGDGNLHFNVRSSSAASPSTLEERRAEVDRLVFDLVQERGGSLSAEHGIGQARCRELAERKGAVDLSLMRSIKRALDPEGFMNPGKLFLPTELMSPPVTVAGSTHVTLASLTMGHEAADLSPKPEVTE
jgi:FAD/FMN-containing dehydrogenase